MTPPNHRPPLFNRPVLVAGAAGFVGSHLVDRLLGLGAEVIGIDDLSTGDAAHLAHLAGEPRFHAIRHDITQPLPAGLDDCGAVFNLACPASPAYYQRHPVRTVLTSSVGTWRLLELARSSGARLLQASTSEVYGDPQVHPQNEEYWGHVNPIGMRACYDEGKRCAEATVYAYAREHGLAVRVARLFNCYGPRLRPGDGRVVSNFIVQALAGRPLTVYGNGLQTRSFCHVSDTVDALLRLMLSDTPLPVNIGNPAEHTVLALAGMVRELTGSTSPITHHPLPSDDPVRRRPDIGRAQSLLGWTPEVGLSEGLQRTIAWFATAPEAQAHPLAQAQAESRPEARLDIRPDGAVTTPLPRLPGSAGAGAAAGPTLAAVQSAAWSAGPT